MSSSLVADRKTWFETVPYAAAVAGAGAVAWAGTIWIARGMVSMLGTMGFDLPTFAGIWTHMMAAMMLPSIALVAGLYARSIASNRVVRLASLCIGYLVAWSILAPFVYALAEVVSAVAQRQETIAHINEAAALIAVSAYQLSPLRMLASGSVAHPSAKRSTSSVFAGGCETCKRVCATGRTASAAAGG